MFKKCGARKVVLLATPVNPFGPSSLMPQNEMNSPAHLHERKIKENLNYTVLSPVRLHLASGLLKWSALTGSLVQNISEGPKLA